MACQRPAWRQWARLGYLIPLSRGRLAEGLLRAHGILGDAIPEMFKTKETSPDENYLSLPLSPLGKRYTCIITTDSI